MPHLRRCSAVTTSGGRDSGPGACPDRMAAVEPAAMAGMASGDVDLARLEVRHQRPQVRGSAQLIGREAPSAAPSP